MLTSRRPGSSRRWGSPSERSASAARSVEVTASAYSSGVPTAWLPAGSPLSGSRSCGKPPPKSSSSGCQPKRSWSSAMHSAIRRAASSKASGVGRSRLTCRCRPRSRSRLGLERAGHELEQRRAVDAPLVVARVGRDRRQVGRERARIRVAEGQHAQADVCGTTELRGEAGDEVELGRVVDVDRHAGLDGRPQLCRLLVAAVQDERRDARPQRHGQLAEPEAVAADALLDEHAPDRQVRVRLRRIEERDARPARLERVAQPADVRPDLRLGGDVERRPELLGQRRERCGPRFGARRPRRPGSGRRRRRAPARSHAERRGERAQDFGERPLEDVEQLVELVRP